MYMIQDSEGVCCLEASFLKKEKKYDSYGLSFRLAIEPFLKPCTFIVWFLHLLLLSNR